MPERIRKARSDGFTLIELLIVIIILGILAAIVVFAIGGTRKDSVQASCVTDVKSIQLSGEGVYTKMGDYPPTGSAAANGNGENLLEGNTLGPNSTNNGALLKTWPGGHTLTAGGALDPAKNSYQFTYSHAAAGTKDYSLVIAGKDVTGGTLTKSSDDVAVNAACKGV